LLWPAEPDTLTIDSESQVEPETLARMPVIGLTFLVVWVIWNMSFRVWLTSDIMIVDLAASRSGSPMKAETLILPAGAVNEKRPFSSASAYPIGIQ